MIKFFVAFVFAIFQLSFCYSQNEGISVKVNFIVNELAKCRRFEYSVSNSNIQSKQINLFDKLLKEANVNELIILTNHNNKIVKVYALKALEERKYKCEIGIILKHIYDNDLIECYIYGFGYIHDDIYKMKVAEFFASYKYLDSLDRMTLYKNLIFSKNILNFTDNLLKTILPDENYYEQIRKLVQMKRYKFAVIALARFNKIEDKWLINDRINEYSISSMDGIVIRNAIANLNLPILSISERGFIYQLTNKCKCLIERSFTLEGSDLPNDGRLYSLNFKYHSCDNLINKDNLINEGEKISLNLKEEVLKYLDYDFKYIDLTFSCVNDQDSVIINKFRFTNYP